MSDDGKQSLPTTRRSDSVEMQIVEQVLAAPLDNARQLIAHHLETLQAVQRESELALFLRSFWDYLEGLRVVREEGNFDLAVKLEESAATGFEQLGIGELESVARCMSAYATAMMEVRRLNINRGLELLAETEEFLRNAGRFGTKFQPLIDHMKPEPYFLGFCQLC